MLIRADGGVSDILGTQIPGRLSRLADGKNKGVLIDFMDRFSGWTGNRSRKRLQLYESKGWEVKQMGTPV